MRQSQNPPSLKPKEHHKRKSFPISLGIPLSVIGFSAAGMQESGVPKGNYPGRLPARCRVAAFSRRPGIGTLWLQRCPIHR
ncbi:hypothetical protein CEXT_630901 [Caerostris extrusa]|uniref:Uncharacterized protein n=1 Tax=Caerostris extrusa TaxID=172846 RepID=A0AAV4Q951_CAEEX|nr:hypothetical protein CEXT_630901 [Caerostris extrusa]